MRREFKWWYQLIKKREGQTMKLSEVLAALEEIENQLLLAHGVTEAANPHVFYRSFALGGYEAPVNKIDLVSEIVVIRGEEV
jgi:hypothetical protein